MIFQKVLQVISGQAKCVLPRRQKNKNAFRMESVKIQMYGMSPTGTVSASLRFVLPPAVRMFRTHAQAGLFCEFRVLCACAGSLVGRGRPLREQSPLRSDARFADANWHSDCHRQSECSEPMRKRVYFVDFEVLFACAGSLIGTGCKKPCHPKGWQGFLVTPTGIEPISSP